MHAELIAEIGNGEAPHRDKILTRSMPFPPPEPVAIELVEWPKDHRRQRTVLPFHRMRKIGYRFEYQFILFVMRTAWFDECHRRL
ncbi:hypothetical protein D3C86_1709030 [compost metagenome]